MRAAKNGLYALVSLGGAPLRREDLDAIGAAEALRPGQPGLDDAGIVLRLRDRTPSPDSGVAARGDEVLAFLGELDAPETLAAALGLRPQTPAAELALRALARWGDEAWERLEGQWSLLKFDRAAGALTLAASPALRDDLYFTASNDQVAVAPSAIALRGPAWAGGALDPLGLMQSMSNWSYRARRAGRSPFAGVGFVEWGQWVRFERGGRIARARFDELRAPPRWTGDFQAAAAELEVRARRAVDRRARRHTSVAIALSGGLDSSGLAWLARQTQRTGQRICAVSSVSPAGSGIPDERRFIETVAQALELPTEFVAPPDNADILIPPAHIFDHAEAPIVGPRHYLYDALHAAARDAGASAILDGAMGEFSLSRRATLATPLGQSKRLLRQGLELARRSARAQPWPWTGLHVEPSAEALQLMTEAFGNDAVERPETDRPLRPSQPMGYPAGVLKVGKWLTDTPGGELRHIKPFFDRSMIELVAATPASFTHAAGLPRSFVRAMLQDRLPASVVRRTSKAPFSPDFYQRLSRHAPAARARIADWRTAGADQWLDLDWLDRMLARIAEGPLAPAVMFRIQSTANAAEFFVWLAGKG